MEVLKKPKQKQKLPYGESLELTDTLRYSTNLRGNKDSEE